MKVLRDTPSNCNQLKMCLSLAWLHILLLDGRKLIKLANTDVLYLVSLYHHVPHLLYLSSSLVELVILFYLI